MRPSQHGSNKKSRADLIWGGERDRKDQKQSREKYITRREVKKISLEKRWTRLYYSED